MCVCLFLCVLVCVCSFSKTDSRVELCRPCLEEEGGGGEGEAKWPTKKNCSFRHRPGVLFAHARTNTIWWTQFFSRPGDFHSKGRRVLLLHISLSFYFYFKQSFHLSALRKERVNNSSEPCWIINWVDMCALRWLCRALLFHNEIGTTSSSFFSPSLSLSLSQTRPWVVFNPQPSAVSVDDFLRFSVYLKWWIILDIIIEGCACHHHGASRCNGSAQYDEWFFFRWTNGHDEQPVDR